MWYYKRTEPNLWTVMCGEGANWVGDSDHGDSESAAARVAYLNGQIVAGNAVLGIAALRKLLDQVEKLDRGREEWLSEGDFAPVSTDHVRLVALGENRRWLLSELRSVVECYGQ